MSAEKAKLVRKALKDELGLNARQVSVRSPHWGSIYVTIKTADASFAKVEEIAKRVEHVRRCEYSGDILCGGNTFVNVEFDDAVVEKAAENPAITKAVEEAKAKPGFCIDVDGTNGVSLSYDDCQNYILVWNNEGIPQRLWANGTLKYDCRAVARNLLMAA